MAWMRWTRAIGFALILVLGGVLQSPARAQAEPIEPQKFGTYPAFSMPALSPNADYYAALVVTDKGRFIEARHLADDKAVVRVSVGIDEIHWMGWTDEEHLLVARTPFFDNYAVLGDGELGKIEGPSLYVLDITDRSFSAPLKRKYPAYSGDYGAGYFRNQTRVLKWPNSTSGSLLLQLFESRSRMGAILSPSIYAFSPRTGKAKILEKAKASIKGHGVDRDGRLRIRYGEKDDNPTINIYDVVSEKWLDYTNRVYGAGSEFSIKGFSFDPDILYVASDHEMSPGGLYEYRISTNTFETLIANHPVYEINDVSVSRLRKTLSKVTAGQTLVYMSPEFEASWDSIQAAFPASVSSISDLSYDESTLIVSIERPNDPIRYYVTQVGTDEYRELGAQYRPEQRI